MRTCLVKELSFASPVRFLDGGLALAGELGVIGGLAANGLLIRGGVPARGEDDPSASEFRATVFFPGTLVAVLCAARIGRVRG